MYTGLHDVRGLQCCLMEDEGARKGLLPRMDRMVTLEDRIVMTEKFGFKQKET